MDRCALFVDAGYVLADGAMAVHGTRRSGSLTWDCEGLVRLLSSLATERTGLPVLRCYWYEATVDGRRTAEHEALADMPGIKLRVAKVRPGRREGVQTEIYRDLTTLARNNAVSDALVISADEDLAQVMADVQDLGMRVTLVHVAVDGSWTVSRALRQESDDILEISGDHLRPYVEMTAGAVPPHQDAADGDHAAGRPLANGHSPASAASYQVPAAPANHAPPASYTAPVVAEYQRPAVQLPEASGEAGEPRDTRDDRARDERLRDERAREERAASSAVNGEALPAPEPDTPAQGGIPARPDTYVAPATSARSWPGRHEPGRHEPGRHEPAPNLAARAPAAEEVPGYPPGPRGPLEPASAPPAAEPPSGQLRRLPSSRDQASPGPMGASGAAVLPGQHGGQDLGRSAPYSGPQPVLPTAPSGGYQPGDGVSLSEAVQAAHEEGQEFGGSVARDAPALWLEAVLARKPRMPSDLEARLLQGSALPIDYLLHDEVRHALRRGFWDALERTRR